MSVLLLQLPPEVLLAIIEFLHDDYCLISVYPDPDETIDISWLFDEQERWYGNPLRALRL